MGVARALEGYRHRASGSAQGAIARLSVSISIVTKFENVSQTA